MRYDDEGVRKKYHVVVKDVAPAADRIHHDSVFAMNFDPLWIRRTLRRSESHPRSAFVRQARKDLGDFCNLMESVFSKQHLAADFDFLAGIHKMVSLSEST